MAIFNTSQYQTPIRTKFGAQLLGAAGKAISGVSKIGGGRLPQIVPGGLGAQLQSTAGYTLSRMNPLNPPSASASEDSQVLGTQTQQPTYDPNRNFGMLLQPSTGGQAAAPTSGGDMGYQQPVQEDNSAYLQQLKDAYGGLRSTIEGQLPGLEADYTRVKGDVEGAVGRAKEVFGERTGDINRGFGEGLRNLLMTDKEIGQKSRNVYSGLNALDSSSYAESENKRQQNLFDTQGKLETNKQSQLRDSEREYQAYESQANSQLATLGSQYMQGKQAIQAALAQNNLEEATSIQNAMYELQDRARQIQDTVNAYKMNLGQLAAQGVDVVGNLNKYGRGALDSIFSNYQTGYANPAASSLNIPTRSYEGVSGYISPRTGKRYSSYDEFTRAEG